MDEQTKQALSYIQHQRSAGRSDDDIRASLRASGWTEPAMDQLFANAGSSQAAPAQPQSPEQPAQPQPAEQAVKPTGQHKFRQPKLLVPKQLPKWALYVIGGVILLIIIILALIFINSRTHRPTPQQAASNQLRQADANSIAAAMRAYATKQIYQLPDQFKPAAKGKALTFCNDKCDAKTSQSAKLAYYQANHVTRHKYDDTLKAPDPQTVYIVYNASCDTDHKNIGEQVAAHHASVAILYALAPYYAGNLRCQVI